MRKITTAIVCAMFVAGCSHSVAISEQPNKATSSFKEIQTVEAVKKEKVLLQVPLIKQLPELPRGCEVTSLAMLLRHAGVNVDKMTLAKEVRKDPTPYQRKNGITYFGNPNQGFVGNMYDINKPGLGVYSKPITDLAERYLPGRVVNLTGSDFAEVMQHVEQEKPVWVINNTWFSRVPAKYWVQWQTPQGKMKITYKEHSVLITGYDEQNIYFNDPLAGMKNRKVPKAQFQKGWEQMGRHAITYK
ncbi:C39 family peptidase [Alkalihalobacillus sp. TS-13]|uniref:C39 family peptidase n=1 Tax=Alkalihalobacillus sp. TS-13 TaxID=2842455 RepID=UPI0021AAEF1B|nr:C39 family peptidase [Alkalihalobacillus sp. TS-13]